MARCFGTPGNMGRYQKPAPHQQIKAEAKLAPNCLKVGFDLVRSKGSDRETHIRAEGADADVHA
jgi:hypothetical protein